MGGGIRQKCGGKVVVDIGGTQHTAGAYLVLIEGRPGGAGQGQRSVSCLAVENLAHCEFPLLRDLLIR